MTLLCVRVRWLMVCLGIAGYLVSTGVDQAFAQGRIVEISQFPSISIKDFQNAKFAGSVANDRKVLLG